MANWGRTFSQSPFPTPLPSHWTPAIPQGAFSPWGSCEEKSREPGTRQGRPITALGLPICLCPTNHQQETNPSLKLTSFHHLPAASWRDIIKISDLPNLRPHLCTEHSLCPQLWAFQVSSCLRGAGCEVFTKAPFTLSVSSGHSFCHWPCLACSCISNSLAQKIFPPLFERLP